MRIPYVTLSAGREGGFEFGAVTPDIDGYSMEVRYIGSFGLSLRVDSLVAAPEPPADRP